MIFTAGVDVGTSAVKVAIVASDGSTLDAIRSGGGQSEVIAHTTERLLRRSPSQVSRLAFRAALRHAGLEEDQLAYVSSTGDGDAVDFRTGHFFGMTAHARGAIHLLPEARGLVDVGALHARALVIDPRGRVLQSRMTSQCASGAGQFVENIARHLGVRLEEIGRISREAERAESISGICSVLAETDVINMVSRGVATPEILRGIHESIAQRLSRLVRFVKAESPLLITGGLSADEGLRAALAERLARDGPPIEVRSHPLSTHAGAIGAALWGAYRHGRLTVYQPG